MSEQLKQLQNKRSSIKGQLTRFNNFFEKFINEQNTDFVQLESRLTKVEELWERFNDIQSDIELLDAENTINHEEERELFESIYFDLTSKVKQHMKHGANSETDRVSENKHVMSQNVIFDTSQIKLPSLNLPNFDGSYHQWLFFRDTFSSIIDKNKSISEIQKFHYLRLSLKDEAAAVIRSLEISATNYKVAWELLLERFENKQLLISNHVKGLFNMPAVVKESHNGLRQLLDGMLRHLRALEVLEQPTKHWDTLIIHLISTKLDGVTRREWEKENSKDSLSTLDQFTIFLKDKCRLLETLEINNSEFNLHIKSKPTKAYISTSTFFCNMCKGDHTIYNCPEFLKLDSTTRLNEVKRLKLCINCLRKGHFKDCRSNSCRKCEKPHHTLLHFETLKNQILTETPSETNVTPTVSTVDHILTNYSCRCEFSHIILSTVIIQVADKFGNIHECRALLDNGSQSNFITADLCNKLQLQKNKIDISICGINQTNSNVKYRTFVKMQSRINSFKTTLSCLVITKITGAIPALTFKQNSLNIPSNLILADPTFNISSHIDILIGADTFWDLLSVGQVKLGKNLPTLQKTHLGWVVSGPICNQNIVQTNVNCNLITYKDLDKQLTKFWEIEEFPKIKHFSSEELYCEEHFMKNTVLDINGRFIVSIPLKEDISKLGDSKQTALRRFSAIEKKLNKNSEMKKEYVKFMNEYENLQHMTKIENPNDTLFYLPHHCVIKDSSSTTKLRVVFDGSCKTSSKYSVNDIMMVGPTIQQDLLSIILRFRKYNVVLTGDIAKMYRQVLIKQDQRSLQRIFWREQPTDELAVYELNTITYGTAAASFLAIRCLHEVAKRSIQEHPKIAAIILNDFYVDDLLTGGDSLDELQIIKQEISLVLKKYGFELRKWASNCSELLDGHITNSTLNIGEAEQTKTLGLLWNSTSDCLGYTIMSDNTQQKVTKRSILSSIAQVFDPLGLLSPVTITAKIILQKLWQHKISWDESIPLNLYTLWTNFRSTLQQLNKLKIPRHVFCHRPISTHIHGFSDASESAYGACLYIVSSDASGNIFSSLLCSKTRVAPLKTVTIPRLELCGALLLAELMEKAKVSMNIHFERTFYWCDSNIVLSWIKSSSHLFKIFIANRISQIQTLTNPNDWYYVHTKDNPADLLSRGTNPNNLITSKLWWHGPEWLSSPIWPLITNETLHIANLPEMRSNPISLISTTENFDIITKFSSLTKLQRIVAYCLRFCQNLRQRKETRQLGPLTALELNSSLNCLIRLSQKQTFSQETHDLLKLNLVSSKSKLSSLNPFIDKDGIIRVGGRLKNSNFDSLKMHPAVLSSKHYLTILIARNEHLRLLHAGPQTLLASIRERFWPLSGRNLVRKVVHDCVRCFRFNPGKERYIMGNLPKTRLSPTRPFLISGLDFAGPFSLKDRKTRNYKILKSYVCLFVCFSTKAIHLELVGDLTTESFLAALRRFVARRGKCAQLFSDNATNFHGAKSELQKFLRHSNDEIQTTVNQEGMEWHFIPPRAPHFGGLWEAGVKSVKYHIKRVVGDTALSFEEFITLLAQIESCLNSRPICQLSNDPGDPSPLTPGHFIIGESLTALPDYDLSNVNENRLKKFQRMQQLLQHFWSRWSKEYISELQQRVKWKTNHQTLIKPGILVIVKEDGLPPLKWRLGRIFAVHPGADGVVRSVTIKCLNGTYQRPVVKICVLPNQDIGISE